MRASPSAHATTTHEYCILYGPVSCSIIIYCPVVCTRGHVSTFHFRLSLDNSAEYIIIIWQLTPAPAAQQWPHNSRVLTSWMHLCVVQGELLFSVIVTQIGMGATPTHTHIHHTMRMLPPDVSIFWRVSPVRGYNLWATLFWRQWLKVFRRDTQPSLLFWSRGQNTRRVCDKTNRLGFHKY